MVCYCVNQENASVSFTTQGDYWSVSEYNYGGESLLSFLASYMNFLIS